MLLIWIWALNEDYVHLTPHSLLYNSMTLMKILAPLGDNLPIGKMTPYFIKLMPGLNKNLGHSNNQI